jgi:hypothetical protein
MCVARVLELPDEFAQTTTVAIRREGNELSALGLPIVECVGESAHLSVVLSNTNFIRSSDRRRADASNKHYLFSIAGSLTNTAASHIGVPLATRLNAGLCSSAL